jgi:hypothetical protein
MQQLDLDKASLIAGGQVFPYDEPLLSDLPYGLSPWGKDPRSNVTIL